MTISNEIMLDFDDVLIKPKRSVAASRASVKINRRFVGYHSRREFNGLPIFASNMAVTGTFQMAKSLLNHNAATCLHKFHTKTKLEHEGCLVFEEECFDDRYLWMIPQVFISTGIENSDTLKAYMYHYLWSNCSQDPNLCVDVANGYTDKFCDAIKRYRDTFPEAMIMAGNVATPEMVQQLILSGADIVKIGIGPGKACQTRMVAGVGVPQLSAIIECADAAHGLKRSPGRNGLICADGGISTPADVCKAFGAGADFVMLGSMLAGTDECDGKWTYVDDTIAVNTTDVNYKPPKKSLRYYGMSSYEAQKEHYGEAASYRATEGKVLQAPYKGPVSNIMKEIEGGLRSCCAYVGADSLKDLSKCTTLVRVNRVHRTPEWTIT